VKKTTLIVAFPGAPDSDSPYARAAASEACRRSRKVALAVSGRAPPPGGAGGDDGVVGLALRPGSALSTRSLFLEADNACGPVSELILILEPGRPDRGLSDFGPAESEAFAEELVKACFQILREFGQRAGKRGDFSTAFALPEAQAQGSDKVRPQGLARLERDFIASLADCRLAESQSERPVFAVSGDFESPQAFAQFMFKLLDDPRAKGAGKWARGGRGGFLGIF
jgi:hypothetical protein